MLTVGSLFSGIGGFDLGLERAGLRTVWFCEQDEFCQRVLAKHWPGVPCHSDVRTLVADTALNGRGQGRSWRSDPDGAGQLEPALHAGLPVQVPYGGSVHPPGCWLCEWAEEHYAERGAGLDEWILHFRRGHVCRSEPQARPPVDTGPVFVPYVDVLCGGFPCQDLSYAGRGAGIDGERSGLWGEFARLIRELRPRYVIVENVPALLSRGLGRVLGDLAACGYDAEWDCVPASAVGAPHRRDRIWIVAYPNGGGFEVDGERDGRSKQPGLEASCGNDADRLRTDVAYPDSQGSQGHGGEHELRVAGSEVTVGGRGGDDASARTMADAEVEVERVGAGLRANESRALRWGRSRDGCSSRDWWLVEPDVGRVAHGIPARVDRLRSLGNALIPQIAEWIGQRIVEWELTE